MAGRRGDWVPCDHWGTTEDTIIAGAGAIDVLLVSCKDVLGVPDEVATVEQTNAVIAKRVVGQVDIVANGDPGSSVLFIERIRVGILDNLGARAFYANSFFDGPDANEPFLWQRVSRLEEGATNLLASFGHPYWSCIDVRVSRRLETGEALWYSVQTHPGTVSTLDLHVMPLLRTWATAVG